MQIYCDYASPECEGEVTTTLDPYALEINEEEHEITVCAYHYQERADDI